MRDHHPIQPQQGTAPHQLPAQRPANTRHPQSHPDSPHQTQHPGAFPSPHSSNHGVPLQHHSPYPHPGPGPNGHPPHEVFYGGSPYAAPVPGQYSSAEAPELMAAAQMQQRSYSVYHTPQSNSPASVTSSQSHDQHGRMYSQPPQMQQGMYSYPQHPSMSYVQQSSYPQHPSQQPQPQHQMMTSQPVLPHQQGHPSLSNQQSPAQPPGITSSPRTQPKLEPTMSRPLDQSALQRSPTGPMASNHNTPTGSAQNGTAPHPGQQGGGPGVNPNAAPGPIPATTPLVVRQDNNGVQWIAFEYSRDRVKMEYTIRCDVESVNVDGLAESFRLENCVYPRACGKKEDYRGNRLQYETECNTVGWSLAQLNPCLRGKRGLIQRAVDSWRNSNQDSKLRSRRVRRMNKMNTRNKPTAPPPNHMAGPREVGGPPPGATPMATPMQQQQRPPPPNMSLAGPAQLQHHRPHPDGSTADDVSVNGDYDPRGQAMPKTHPDSSPGHIRPSHVFQGYSSYPTHPNSSIPSLPPQLHNGADSHLPHHAATTIAGTLPATSTTKTDSLSPPPTRGPAPLLPEAEPRKRKFILVDDTERQSRVRVKVNLEGVDTAEIPDSYRKSNSVYPRSYFPTQMQLSPKAKRERSGDGRFADDVDVEDTAVAGAGRCTVKVPMVEGREDEVAVPRLGRAVRAKEERMNDLGYRMSWTQSRVFAGRIIFLQRSLDAYRNKMKITTTFTASAFSSGRDDVSVIPPLSDTRHGKRLWSAKTVREKRAAAAAALA